MKILILDKQGLFLDAAVLFLQQAAPEIEIITASSMRDGAEIMRRHNDIHLVLIDMERVGDSGVQVIDHLKEMRPDIMVGVISEPLSRNIVRQIMQKGAVGYFPKGMRAEAFAQALRYVLSGEKFIPFEVEGEARFYKPNETVRDYMGRQDSFSYGTSESGGSAEHGKSIRLPTTDTLVKLSSREIQTLSKLGKGLSNKEIANLFDIKEVTVKQHVRSLLRKLHVKNRTEAALIARDLNL